MDAPNSSMRKAAVVSLVRAVADEIPIVGGIVSATFDLVSARQRQRDEEFMAYVVATGELNDERLQAIARGDDDEFVATAYRIFRAARESADDEYRQMLARVLARSGNWSDIPYSEREELLPVVLILTPRHVMLLEFLSDPRAWMKSRGIVPVEYLWVSGTTSLVAMINKYFFAAEGGAPSAGWALDAWGYLERSGLVVPDREVAPMDVFAPATTSRGNRVIAYVREGD